VGLGIRIRVGNQHLPKLGWVTNDVEPNTLGGGVINVAVASKSSADELEGVTEKGCRVANRVDQISRSFIGAGRRA
jgi:hypothetical protein